MKPNSSTIYVSKGLKSIFDNELEYFTLIGKVRVKSPSQLVKLLYLEDLDKPLDLQVIATYEKDLIGNSSDKNNYIKAVITEDFRVRPEFKNNKSKYIRYLILKEYSTKAVKTQAIECRKLNKAV